MSLLEKFDELMGHLNSEDNKMATEFRKNLKVSLEAAEMDTLWRSCLESGGVDNWSGFGESLSYYWECKEELEEERADD